MIDCLRERVNHCRQAMPMTRVTSPSSNGFINTSYPPRFRTSAHRFSSAVFEVTSSNGESGPFSHAERTVFQIAVGEFALT